MDHGLDRRDIEVLICVSARLRKIGILGDDPHGKSNDVMRLSEIYGEQIGIEEYNSLLAKLDRFNERHPTVEPPA